MKLTTRIKAVHTVTVKSIIDELLEALMDAEPDFVVDARDVKERLDVTFCEKYATAKLKLKFEYDADSYALTDEENILKYKTLRDMGMITTKRYNELKKSH